MFSVLLLVVIYSSTSAVAQELDFSKSSQKHDVAFEKLKVLLDSNAEFEKAVFISEQVIGNNFLSYEDFDMILDGLALEVSKKYRRTQLEKYRQPDSFTYRKNHSIFSSLFDSLPRIERSVTPSFEIPYSYSHDDSQSLMLVTKLLDTHKGNCRSLSYLYKIVADKIGAKCWLALAPNHIYIKNFSQQYGWYNTELTSRSFPTDAWIMASGYISADAVRSKIYMDTLSNQQSIGLCILDLAKSYEYETRNYYDGFILKCCDLVLRYHSTNPMALLQKAETLKKIYLKQKEENTPTLKQAYDDMESAYIILAKLHYREMPKEMYDKWVQQMQQWRK